MKRREEIIDAGIEYTLQNRPMCMSGDSFFEEMREMNRNKSFEEGAKWADKTLIEKACKWLDRHKEDYYDYDAWKDVYVNFNMLIEDFKKAMEE